jgi:hypothetical protein
MPSRRSLELPPLVILVALILLVLPFHLHPENFIVDDGYFYPQIARYIVRGQGSTFNGIMPTNGYHPLWMLFCVAGAAITQRSTQLLQLLSVLQDLMLFGSVLLLVAIARAARLRGVWLGCLSVLFFNSVLGIWRMLESPLAFLLQIVALILTVPSCLPGLEQRLGRWRLPLLGFSLGLVMLARLDLIFFAGTIVVFQWLWGKEAGIDSGRLNRTLAPGVVAALVVTPYLVWNWRMFHHLLPISGAIKSTFPHVQPWGVQNFTWPMLLGMALNGLLLFRRQRTPFQTLCLLSAIAAALHLVYTLSFGEVAPWYLTTGTLSLALALAWVLDAVLERLHLGAVPEGVAAALICALFIAAAIVRSTSNLSFTRLRTGQASLHGHYVEPKRALGERLDAVLPAGSRVFINDAPGGVAFYSHMNVVPVDGLVADYAYNRELLELGMAGYAAKHGIRYLIAPIIPAGLHYDRLDMQARRSADGELVGIEAPLLHKPAGEIDLPDSRLTFTFRQVNPDLETTFPELGVWRLQP